MINPRELRIGNLIYDELGKETKIHEIGIFGINGDKIPYCFYSKLNPIPLPKNGWGKFGFEEVLSDMFNKDDLDIQYFKNKFIAKINGEELCIIQYVHQLQNLYFALTGEELTIKEK